MLWHGNSIIEINETIDLKISPTVHHHSRHHSRYPDHYQQPWVCWYLLITDSTNRLVRRPVLLCEEQSL